MAESTSMLPWLIVQICAFGVNMLLRLLLPRKSAKQVLLDRLERARSFEEWLNLAVDIDEVLGNDIWRRNPESRLYDHRLIYNRLEKVNEVLETGGIQELGNIIVTGLVRNLGDITVPRLYNRAYAGTKHVIEDYVLQMETAITEIDLSPTNYAGGLGSQAKMNFFHDSRLAYGRTCLLLQGGSVFGLCHLGVIKALYTQGLLPRVICGNATGALMAALVSVHTDQDLLDFLSGDGINLDAFAEKSKKAKKLAEAASSLERSAYSLFVFPRRLWRWFTSGYVLDEEVLKECVDANVGDITFEEAYKQTGRVLHITISTSDSAVPSLLNYLTAPNVLVRTAALASNAPDALEGKFKIQCKGRDGQLEDWHLPVDAPVEGTPLAPLPRYRKSASTEYDRHTPLSRLKELHNVNHFIVSQARPYLAPFLAPSSQHSNSPRSSKEPWSSQFMRYLILEVQHRMMQLDHLDLLPRSLRRLLFEESVPAASWILVPKVKASDFLRLLRNPRKQDVDYLILKGERSVWPAVSALHVRCAIEVALDKGYQRVRRLKPNRTFGDAPELNATVERSRKRRRTRTSFSDLTAETVPPEWRT
ncbi:hypothetical protein BAUCODRAFT_144428 [Baudoinia panamericana UAMH 10762]|uniref:PNPLA domain-containing protein n=1 Tax=Baudoinia panamericana (strain UAMH 10762) TaxID=717646 RepID=M2N9F9_BAUPA|nr:uncharacterized protein BAUCODRAFT_144428 [Baudoinia panamericana UAMH 10762]EMD00819.1 hypothetical protein BAUCODRAFT_144428 [Baudoinia panamericana UAMH 10762]